MYGMRAPRIPWTSGRPSSVRFLRHSIPDGMQLIARFRTSSIQFRKPQDRQLTLLETS
jgi:hypothetical protein